MGNQKKFTDVRMQNAPVFPVDPMPALDWLMPVKAFLAASTRQKWRACMDGSWTPPALSPMTMFATTFPGCVAGAGIVLSPDIDDRETSPYFCIEVRTGQAWVVSMHTRWRYWRQQWRHNFRCGHLKYGRTVRLYRQLMQTLGLQ